VISTVLYGYVIGWVITSIGLAAFTRRRPRPASVVLGAGAVWPLLVLGAAQFAAIAAVAEIVRVREPKAKSFDDELEELLANADHHNRLGV
jgi:uncharacterized membrane protein YGL010W